MVGVFLGVVALAATVIGYVYAPVGRDERAAFAVSSSSEWRPDSPSVVPSA
jgi:hypothetical protein